MPESTRSSATDAGRVTSTAWAVVLAGGVGARFWPVSTPGRPKQLLPLAGERPILAQTVDRIRPLIPLERVRILTGRTLARPILDTIPELDPDSLWLEPRARGTAPVLAWAATQIVRVAPDAVMISLHADHVIEPEERFRDLLAGVSVLAARQGRLFTLGVVPSRPETGYGYIRPGAALPADDLDVQAFEVDRFVEKPARPLAEEYIASGHLWNTGIFIWPAALLLEQLKLYTPEIAPLLPLLDEGRTDEFFDRAPTISIDEALLERSDRVAVARASFSWDDVGAWDAVARTRTGDANGNVGVGDAWFMDANRCIAWADEGAVVVFGAQDLVVVRAHGITLVVPRERAPELKKMLEKLPERLREPGSHE